MRASLVIESETKRLEAPMADLLLEAAQDARSVLAMRAGCQRELQRNYFAAVG
jgi:hypothetical protein